MDLKEFDVLLHEAEVKLKRLKALYDQWFTGIERTEPTVARKDLDRHFALMAKEKPRNTAARFRLQQLVARYSVYATYWGRIARQIEEGTYERDMRRLRRGHSAPAPANAKVYELEEDVDIDDLGSDDALADVLSALEAPQPAAPAPKKPMLSTFSPFAMSAKKGASNGKPAALPPLPSPPPRAAAPPASAASAAQHPPLPPIQPPAKATFSKPKGPPLPPPRAEVDDPMQRLYRSYVEARRQNNEAGENVRFEKLAASVEQMTAKLREKHGDKKIEFEVVVQNGKVGLKPKVG